MIICSGGSSFAEEIQSHAEEAALCMWQVRGGALLDGKLEEYEAAWMAAGGEDISTRALGDLFRNLGQPLDAYRYFIARWPFTEAIVARGCLIRTKGGK